MHSILAEVLQPAGTIQDCDVVMTTTVALGQAATVTPAGGFVRKVDQSPVLPTGTISALPEACEFVMRAHVENAVMFFAPPAPATHSIPADVEGHACAIANEACNKSRKTEIIFTLSSKHASRRIRDHAETCAAATA
jgi:hypothetical protein